MQKLFLGHFKLHSRFCALLFLTASLLTLPACGFTTSILPTATPPALLETLTPPATVEPSTPLPQTSIGWQTYHSDELGFSIDYPSSWTVNVAEPIIYLLSDEYFGEGPEPLNYYVYIVEYPNPQGRPLLELAAEGLSEELRRTLAFSQTNINAYTVYETTVLPSRSGARTVFFQGEDRYLAVALTPYDLQTPWPGQERYNQIFQSMLESFQFTQ